jgi:putative chitinase
MNPNSFVTAHSDLVYNTLVKYHITNPLRIAHFLAQIHHETGGFKHFAENLNYTPAGLLKTFAGRITPAQAQLYGRIATQKANTKAIANLVYGGAWGKINLGNTKTGDGYNYRGRGLLQLTGKANYEAYKKASSWDVVAYPEWVSNLAIGLDVAGWFWSKSNLNRLADADDILGITKKVNGGQKGIKERKQLLAWYKSQNISIDALKKKEVN